VRNIKSDLARGDRYVLDDLGYFYPDQKKTIQFQPDLKINLMLDSYGLSIIHYRDEVVPLRALKYKNIAAGSQGSYYRAGVRKWIYTAAAASVVTAVVLLTLPFGPAGDRLLDISSINPFKNNRTEQTIRNRQEMPVVTPGTLVQDITEKSSLASLSVSGTKTHHVIVGSYSNFGNAREQIHKMRIAGWNARLLFTAADVYRVSVFSSENMEESLEQLQAVRAGISYSAWLYSE
jgi:hypothetical protein